MRRLHSFLLGLCLAARLDAQSAPQSCQPPPFARAIVAAVKDVFGNGGKGIWPGYNLNMQPVLLYQAGAWQWILNGPQGSTHFRCTTSNQLAGQLVFDYQMDGMTTVAVPVVQNSAHDSATLDLANFAFLVHEAFHQFQHGAFQDLDTPSEERYPLQHSDNNALAALEMHVLADAVRALQRFDTSAARDRALTFIAVRDERWRNATPLMKQFERSKEITEGTAKYVEVRSVGVLTHRCAAGSTDLVRMCAALRGRTAEAYLLDDFQARFTDGALAPEDVPRNRIYSIAAALGVLLDAFHIPWQLDAARGDSAFSLTNALRKSLASDEEDIAQRFKQAREEYGFDGIKATSQRLMADYSRAYDRAIAAFNAQPGVRIDVELSAAGLSRSRSSRGTRWVVDQGQTVFASEYAAYTLRRAGHDTISVTVTNKGLLDSSSGATRRIVFFVPVVTGINVDGANVDRADGEFHFRSLSLTAPNASITLRANGTIRRNGDVIRITALD